MIWIAPSEKDQDNAALEKRLWDTADQFRANSGLKAQEYSGPILGIIFLRFAEVRFAQQRAKLEKVAASSRRGSRVDEPAAYHAEGILYLAPNARFDFLLNLPEAKDIGAKVNDAMRDVAKYEVRVTNSEVPSVRHSSFVIRHSLVPATVDYDAFGRIYERAECRSAKYEFRSVASSTIEIRHSTFAIAPSCIVRLLTEVIEPYHGCILDPACGSGVRAFGRQIVLATCFQHASELAFDQQTGFKPTHITDMVGGSSRRSSYEYRKRLVSTQYSNLEPWSVLQKTAAGRPGLASPRVGDSSSVGP